MKYTEWYLYIIALTYTAPVIRLVAVHDRPVVDAAQSLPEEAAALENCRVFCAKHMVEYDIAIRIPPDHLRGQ